MTSYLFTEATGRRSTIDHLFLHRQPQLLLLLLTLVVVAGLWIAVTGVRGVDQYWYLNDTRTLIDGGEPVTNALFPAVVLRAGTADVVTYFLHNSPVLYVNALIGQYIGAFNAWKLTNLLFLVATAMLAGLATRLLTGRDGWAYCAYLIYLLSPLAVWQTANLFQESFLAFLTASLLCLLLLARQGLPARELAAVVLFVGILCHPAYLLLAVIFLAWLVWERAGAVRIALMAGAFMIAKTFQHQWFPSSFQPDLLAIVTSSVAYKSNMFWHLSDTPIPLSFKLFYDKLVQGVQLQFFNLKYMPLTIVTNLGLLGFMWLLIRRRQQYQSLLVFAFLMFGMIAGMIVLMQNAPRYQLIAAPVAVVCLVLALSTLPLHRPQWLTWRASAIAVGLMVFVAADISMLRYARDSARQERVSTEVLMQQLDHYPADTRFALIDDRATERYTPLIAALSPRRVLIIEPGLLSQDGFDQVLHLYNPDVVITGVPDRLDYTNGKTLNVLNDGFYKPQTLIDIRNSSG